MATISTSWTENQSFTGGVTAQTNIAQTTTGTVDAAASGYDLCFCQVEITSMGTSNSVTVEVFGSPDSGTTTDDVPLQAYTVSGVEVRSFYVAAPQFSVKITDNDSTSSVDTDGHWAGRKWTSA